MCKFCAALKAMIKQKDIYHTTIFECAIVEEAVLYGDGKKFPLRISDNGPRDFNGFTLNYCPECGKKLDD